MKWLGIAKNMVLCVALATGAAGCTQIADPLYANAYRCGGYVIQFSDNNVMEIYAGSSPVLVSADRYSVTEQPEEFNGKWPRRFDFQESAGMNRIFPGNPSPRRLFVANGGVGGIMVRSEKPGPDLPCLKEKRI